MTKNIEIKRHISEFNSESLHIKRHILQLIEIIRSKHVILVAGGAIRDHISGNIPKDIDLCTSAKPDELSQLLVSNNISVKPVGKAFGVTIALLKDDNGEYEEVEIATFRTDGIYLDGRRPESVDFIDDPREDAIRRDLTINGLFYDPFDETVIDYVNGIKDLQEGVLRFIGDPNERISEDKLRMLRYVRFLLKTGFNSDELSEQAIRDNAEQIKVVSAERIKDELDKIFKIGPISKALHLLKDLNLLEQILPEVDQLSYCPQGPPYHMEGDVFIHTCMTADNLPKDTSNELRWAAILHDIGKPATRKESKKGKVSFIDHAKIGSEMTDEICRRFKMSNAEKKKIVWMIENHQKVLQLPQMKQPTAKKLVLNSDLNEVNPYFEDLLKLAQADEKGAIPLNSRMTRNYFRHILARFQEIEKSLNEQKESGIDFSKLITGHDVIRVLGLNKSGPIIGQVLREVRDELLEMPNPTREDALGILYKSAF